MWPDLTDPTGMSSAVQGWDQPGGGGEGGGGEIKLLMKMSRKTIPELMQGGAQPQVPFFPLSLLIK